jgi:hypothetical protein
VDADQSGPKLAGRKIDGRIQVGVDGRPGCMTLVRNHQAIEITLRTPSVPRCTGEHQLA